uniref:Tuberous sclerosis 2 n=2 Tax=Bursaphelenchus xylophilus TaxID=6326 RepID=A0A1I7SNR8_BURXY
ALRFRTGIFMSGEPPLSPSMPRRSLVRESRQFSTIPVFMKHSLEKRDSEMRDSA